MYMYIYIYMYVCTVPTLLHSSGGALGRLGGEAGALVPNLLRTVPNLLERRAMRWRMQGAHFRGMVQ